MDQTLRNKLRNVVTKCRKLLEDAVAQVLQGQFGIYPSGKKDDVHIEDEARMGHLGDEDRVCRSDLLDHFQHIVALGYKPKDALAQLVREVAFTHLNRLCAYKMMEAREVWVGGQRFREAVSRGLKSQGFLFYLAQHPEDEQRYNTGQQDIAYRHFLDWLGGTLSEEIGVLFSPTDPANRLYPPQRVLDEVLDLLNTGDIKAEERDLQEAWPKIWSQDETIGWVYQYFTPKELRDQARKESAAPRNSYELAFRNQFFTPRYVVQFLTDNTLGRIWYEMRRGETKLTQQCSYMVRRPNEIFLEAGQEPPAEPEQPDDLSQEELLNQPVHIPHRPKKDPRELKILDPACGSGHFLLYCFDLLLTIYEEAWADPGLPRPVEEGQGEGLRPLRDDYPTLDALRCDMPRLILAHNLHGIDIDLRATQIAALALWLRCQRAYKDMGLTKDRPTITRSNIVCAEPMPGEKDMLKEFVAELQPAVLGHLVEVVFDKMKLAAEAGSLLKIEEELRSEIASVRKQWAAEHERVDSKGRPLLFSQAELDRAKTKTPQQTFDFSQITDEQFWAEAEDRVLDALRDYAFRAANGRNLRRQLFAEDAGRGFAFVDVCQKRFDVVLMNPPFGDTSVPVEAMLKQHVSFAKGNTYISSVVFGVNRLVGDGMLGAITDASFIHQTRYEEFRDYLLREAGLGVPSLIALGWEVLDSFVETACFVLSRISCDETLFLDLREGGKARPDTLLAAVDKCYNGILEDGAVLLPVSVFSALPKSVLTFWLPKSILTAYSNNASLDPSLVDARCGLSSSDNFRFYKLVWEVSPNAVGRSKRWSFLSNGGPPSPLLRAHSYVVDFENNGSVIRSRVKELFGSETRTVINQQYYYRPGFTYGKRTESFTAQFMPEGFVFSNEGQAIFPSERDIMWGVLAYLNSSLVAWLLNSIAGQHKEAGYVGSIPAPPNGFLVDKDVLDITKANYRLLASLSQWIPESFLFVSPLVGCDSVCSVSLKELPGLFLADDDVFANGFVGIDKHLERLMGFIESDPLPWSHRKFQLSSVLFGVSTSDLGRVFVVDIVGYMTGCVFGRWDIRLATNERADRTLPDPLDSLRICPPGMLQDSDGLPATETPPEYPLRIDWDGILTDDPEHADDVIRRIRDILELIWQDRADAIEQEACEILGVKRLRDYFRKPGNGGFWADHISRYSKSRRKAPIYWLLQSAKKNYALWLYYHRLNKDILFKALVNYVEPKIRLEESRLASQRSQKGSGGGTKKLDKEIEKQEDFLSELRDFEDKLRRAANLHLEPDLNDGVVLNIAPLWELVPWKVARKYWEELMDGKYEWSSIGKQLRERGLA